MNQIKFYKVDEPYGFFSNFAPFPIFIDGKSWKTVEHYFQASKFENEEVKEKIRQIDSPMKAANEGRNKRNVLRSDWEEIKDGIMQKAVFNKFLQHPKLRKELILTENSILIEHTKNDSYWADGGDGTGKNMLGVLLMKVRSEIKAISNDPEIILPPWIAFASIDKNDLFWRMGIGENYLDNWERCYMETDKDSYKRVFPANNTDWLEFYDI